jgi:hypothetical protein
MTMDMANAELLHNNLGGKGPDAGEESIHYAGVGMLDDKPFDLKVSAIGKYAHIAGTGSAANGKAGSFGSVNVGYGEMAKLQFAFYWSATGEEVDLPEIRFRFLDLSTDEQAAECKEVLGVDSAERELSYVLGAHPEIMVEIEHTETWFMSEQVGDNLPASLDRTDVTEDQRDRSVTLVFDVPKEADPAAAVAAPAAVSFCQDGILSGPGGVCCPATCGTCGGAACGDSPGGWDNCCATGVKTANVVCTTPTQSACVLPPPAPPVLPPSKFGFKVDLGFTQPTWGNPAQTLHSHTPWCSSGVRGARTMEKICCAGSCGQCGGPACASLPGGYDSCCTGPIRKQNITCADGNSVGCIVPMVSQVVEEERVTALEPFAFSPSKCFNSLKARTFLFDGSVAATCPTDKAAPAWYKRNEMLPERGAIGAEANLHLGLKRAQSKMAAKDGRGMCANGVHSSRTEHLCCDSSCGTCGGAGCEARKGGKARCCATGLTYANRTCSHEAQTACLLPQHASDLRSRLWSRSRLASVLQEELGQLTLQEAEVPADHSSVQQQQQAEAKRARAEKSRVREANLNSN